ncbi:hypothetical protein [Chitinophaga pinensis]|uniref:Uncharacterized protein n=1 Tax=Chitinophaga pinensis (strain ATCC 43595 / DSM 2588 / LMG 13176 / NBRC 15968 / NCIMB 11800 / UQM 2034) TaxID=485918 RepID=A0A979G4D7_CHIPD|nr:hypothetical protein [Chitinophaga pinensis]ACU60644.1 hypothetical protein Cpin_3177 [Chitinophaga pinensis DSM 2588]
MIYHELRDIDVAQHYNWDALKSLVINKNYFHFALMQLNCQHMDTFRYSHKGNDVRIEAIGSQWCFRYSTDPDELNVEGNIIDFFLHFYGRKNARPEPIYARIKQELLILEAAETLKLPAIQHLEHRGYLHPDIYFHSTVPLNVQFLSHLGILDQNGIINYEKTFQARSVLQRTLKSNQITTTARIGGNTVAFTFEFGYRNKERINLFEDIYWKKVIISSNGQSRSWQMSRYSLPDPETLCNHLLNPPDIQIRTINTYGLNVPEKNPEVKFNPKEGLFSPHMHKP